MLMLVPLLALLTSPFAEAHRSSGSHTFRTSSCKSASCFAKHPSGTYVHPIRSRH